MTWVASDQLLDGIRRMAAFRDAVNKQLAQHVFGFLALKWANVGTAEFTPYSEADDYKFADTFLKVRSGDFPYFDPIACSFRIKTHPHSNIATARKGTFFHSWGAGQLQVDDGTEKWQFGPNYIDLLRGKALTKGGNTTLVPAEALAAFLFRGEDIPEKISLTSHFIKVFHLTNKEATNLFDSSAIIGPLHGAGRLTDAEVLTALDASGVVAQEREAHEDFTGLEIPTDDKYLVLARQLLFEDHYSGVVIVGPPGTSKSWYAQQIALSLTDGDASRISKIQFHKSYQYENFVEGFAPTEAGHFEMRPQLIRNVAANAQAEPTKQFVIVIDELSRSDPARVFGELLTYIEPSRREEEFLLASGRTFALPINIAFIATMNSRDKAVSEIDDAFDRRMGKIELGPDPELLRKLLSDGGLDVAQTDRVVAFFKWVNNGIYPLGHTFFLGVRDEPSLARLWQTQLRFVFEKQFKYEPEKLTEIKSKFVTITGAKLPS